MMTVRRMIMRLMQVLRMAMELALDLALGLAEAGMSRAAIQHGMRSVTLHRQGTRQHPSQRDPPEFAHHQSVRYARRTPVHLPLDAAWLTQNG